jgi:hypothetical protein
MGTKTKIAAINLLKIVRQHNKALDDIERAGVNLDSAPIVDCHELLHVVLDLLGYPPSSGVYDKDTGAEIGFSREAYIGTAFDALAGHPPVPVDGVVIHLSSDEEIFDWLTTELRVIRGGKLEEHATPLLTRLGALSAELSNCAKLAAADNNNEASLAFASARDRLEEVVAGFVATDRAAFFNPALTTAPLWAGHPLMNADNTVHGPN